MDLTEGLSHVKVSFGDSIMGRLTKMSITVIRQLGYYVTSMSAKLNLNRYPIQTKSVLHVLLSGE